MTIDDDKRRLRRAAAAGREALAEGNAEAGASLRDRFLAAIELKPGAAVSAFWPMRSEIDVRPLIEALHARGHPVALPVTAGKGLALVFRAWTPDTALVPGAFGARVPPDTAADMVPSVLIVPLLAFDRRGHRLGYGAGFYDRTLAALRPRCLAVGVGFAGQEVPAVPHDAEDRTLDWIVTEREAFKVAR